VELIDIRADQFPCTKVWQYFANVGFSIAEHCNDGLIRVDNIAIVIGNHDIRCAAIECDLDT